ncbi:MAG: dihydroorotate dehydrogenase [Desulfovibrio sp.]|nr:dihydroorotate dehydrogenase [Desulfovibrio sp.]
MVERNCREVKVREIRFLGAWDAPSDFVELTLENPGWESYRPGQFAMLRSKLWGLELPWGRPFSISRVDAESLTFFIQVVGRGTSRLAQLRQDDEVVVWGPLGNGFSAPPETPTLLLAGGMGIAPFRGYIENHPTPEYLSLLFAHRASLDFYPYQSMTQKVRAESIQEHSADDLPGIIGRIEAAMNECSDGLVLACGPTPFLRTVQAHALKKNIRAEISLEKTMACGVGACLGCVCKDAEGKHMQVCTHGPVFPVADVQI